MITMDYQIYKYHGYDSILLYYSDTWHYWYDGLWVSECWYNSHDMRGYWRTMIKNKHLVPCPKLEFLIRTGHAIESTLPPRFSVKSVCNS